MKQYVVKSGQNIYDVSMTLFGSLEGIADLMVNNDSLTLESQLTTGQVLNYDEDFVIDKDLVQWFKDNNIIVKNGNGGIVAFDVKTLIANTIEETNKKLAILYKAGKLSVSYDGPHISKPRLPFFTDDSGNEVWVTPSEHPKDEVWIVNNLDSSFRTYCSYGVGNIFSTRENLVARIKNILGDGFDDSLFTDSGLVTTLNSFLEAGMILLPLDQVDLADFYSRMQSSKIYIHQKGSFSSIRMSPIANQIVLIDWGDRTELEYFHFKGHSQIVRHVYKDTNEHLIKMYGCNSFYSLDFLDAGGKYQPLENIYIRDYLNTPYVSDKNMNRLFIRKDMQ